MEKRIYDKRKWIGRYGTNSIHFSIDIYDLVRNKVEAYADLAISSGDSIVRIGYWGNGRIARMKRELTEIRDFLNGAINQLDDLPTRVTVETRKLQEKEKRAQTRNKKK